MRDGSPCKFHTIPLPAWAAVEGTERAKVSGLSAEQGQTPLIYYYIKTSTLHLLAVGGLYRSGRARGGGNNKDYRNTYKPKFRPTPRNITVGPGDRAHLKCRVENLGTKTVST